MKNISDIEIVSLSPDNWNVLRDLKIKSLQQEPIAFEDFDEGLEKYKNRTEDEWRARLNPDLKNKFWLFAKDKKMDLYIGIIFVYIENNIATIQSVFVDNKYRGFGIGKLLIKEMLNRLKKIKDIQPPNPRSRTN